MSNQRSSPEFKDEAVRQVVDRGFSVAEVAERVGVSAHRLYKWVKAIKPDTTDEQAAALIESRSEVLKLRAQLKRAEEERDVLKKAAAIYGAGTLLKTQSEIPLHQCTLARTRSSTHVSSARSFA